MCIMALSPDPTGSIHVFLAQRPLGTEIRVEKGIRHLVISGGEVQELTTISVQNSPAIALRATTAATGEVHLLWAEQEYWAPSYHENALYLQSYYDGGWGRRIAVLDEQAQPFVLDQDDFDLMGNSDGSIDVFWQDVREYHFLVDLITMGHGGNYAKTYHRRLTTDGWTPVERIQRRGTFEPLAFGVVPNRNGSHDVIWSRTSGSTATMMQSSRSGGQWSAEQTVASCNSLLSQPHVFTIRIGPEAGGPLEVAWVCSRYETTEPGTKKNDLFANLHVSRLLDGVWTSGPILSRNVASVHWLSRDASQSLILIQEYSPRTRFWRPTPVPLMVKTVVRGQCVQSSVLADHSVEGSVEAAIEGNGTIHLVYADPVSDSTVIMKYRRGTVAGK